MNTLSLVVKTLSQCGNTLSNSVNTLSKVHLNILSKLEYPLTEGYTLSPRVKTPSQPVNTLSHEVKTLSKAENTPSKEGKLHPVITLPQEVNTLSKEMNTLSQPVNTVSKEEYPLKGEYTLSPRVNSTSQGNKGPLTALRRHPIKAESCR